MGFPEWLNDSVAPVDGAARESALQHQGQLTKPPGSLGQLEDVAVRLCELQGSNQPGVDRIQITIFAADHGVAAAGVSAFPQEVTGQMVANFAHGGAAISVLSKSLGAVLEVVDVGVVSECQAMPGVVSQRAGPGTANLAEQDAMDMAQLDTALAAGRDAVSRAMEQGVDLFIAGDMGIANTTAAAAVASALLEVEPAAIVGPGTGLDSAGISHKARVIEQALNRYQGLAANPMEALRCVGGFEIAALAGAYIRCAQVGIPALVDGYITTSAALIAVQFNPEVKNWLLFSHRSAEPGHLAMLQQLKAEPLLDIGMRLGEGSGAASLVPLIRLACDLHNNMATFADAGVSDG